MNNKIKRNLVIVAVVLFVGAAAYLNWSYNNKWDLPDAQSALADEEAADPAALQQDAAAQTEDTITGTSDSPYFDEARLVLVCRKMYVSDIRPENFLDPTISGHYPGDTDYHRLYLGEIVKVLRQTE